jgi:hypothetical protein
VLSLETEARYLPVRPEGAFDRTSFEGIRRVVLVHSRHQRRRKRVVTSTELDSVAAEVRSQLEVRIAKLLAGSDAASWAACGLEGFGV